jgi:hypothetical protein
MRIGRATLILVNRIEVAKQTVQTLQAVWPAASVGVVGGGCHQLDRQVGRCCALGGVAPFLCCRHGQRRPGRAAHAHSPFKDSMALDAHLITCEVCGTAGGRCHGANGIEARRAAAPACAGLRGERRSGVPADLPRASRLGHAPMRSHQTQQRPSAAAAPCNGLVWLCRQS